MNRTETEVLVTQEVAAELGIHVQTVRDLSRKLKIKPKRVPRCGAGKGFDRNDVDRLREALGMTDRAMATASA